MERKCTVERPNAAKSCFFEKTNKMEKSLVRLTKEKREKTDKAMEGVKKGTCL